MVCGKRFSPDGKMLAKLESDGTISILRSVSRRALARLDGYVALGVWRWGFSPDGKWFASTGAHVVNSDVSLDGAFHLWAIGSAKELLRLDVRGGGGAFAFSRNGKFLATGMPHSTIVIWDLDRVMDYGS
jgi:WD40 repeat protein